MVCPISLRRTRIMLTRPGAHAMGGKGRVIGRPTVPQDSSIFRTRAVYQNLVAIHSSGPGTSISSARIHLVGSWSDVTGRTPPPGTASCQIALCYLRYPSSSCWACQKPTHRTARPTLHYVQRKETPPTLAGVGSSLDPWRALGSSLPRHAAMQGPLQRRDWNRLR